MDFNVNGLLGERAGEDTVDTAVCPFRVVIGAEKLTSEIMTILINESREEGFKEGQRAARFDIAKSILDAGLTPEETSLIVGLNLDEITNGENSHQDF